MRAKDGVGRYGEAVAVRHLQDVGIEVVARNWRCRDGEIDIIGRDGTTIVICEVKTRSSDRFGQPSEAVTRLKAARLRRLAACWLAQCRPEYGDVRFDVVSVLRPRTGAARVEHLRGAF